VEAARHDVTVDDLRARVEQLQVERDEITVERDEVVAERERYRKLYLDMLELNRKLERGLRGQSSERRTQDDAQLSLAVLGQLLGEDTKPTPRKTHRVKEHERKGPPGRRPLPEDLPRITIEVVPDEVKRDGLDAFERIGEEVSETLERQRGGMVVVRTVRGKYVRKDRERNAETEVFCGEPLDLPIPRGIAGPNLLAETIVRRWDDHMPTNRLHKMYKREGLDLSRSTIGKWHIMLAEQLVKPLVYAMWMDAMAKAPYLCMDATGVLVQAEQKCDHGHFWVVIAPGLHVLFAFSHKHDGDAVDELIIKYGYKGYLVVDAHSVYDHLFRGGDIIECGCWSHTRRYWLDTLSSEPVLANEALVLIKELFMIERQLANAPPKKRKAERQKRSKPVVDAFFKWCKEKQSYALDDTPLDKALTYALNQDDALRRFLTDGRLPIHNNGSELELRREAVGRRNWLFVGSEVGAVTNTTFVTLLASCRMHGLDPQAYLRDLFCLLPSWPMSRILELAPAYWKQTLEQEDTQRRLAANVFRQVALGELHPE
jgi:transposase